MTKALLMQQDQIKKNHDAAVYYQKHLDSFMGMSDQKKGLTMNKIIMTCALLGSLPVVSAQTQLRTSSTPSLDSLKDSRKQMEARTENQLLEKLEAARLEDERNRRQQFDSLNFSVVNDGTPALTN